MVNTLSEAAYKLLIKQAYTSLDNSDYALVWSILPYLTNKLIIVNGW